MSFDRAAAYEDMVAQLTAERQPDANYRQMCVQLTAERDTLQADYDKLFVVKHNLDVDNARLLAELADAKSDARYADKWANRYKDRLTELRALREAAQACVVRGSEPHLYYPPSPAAIGALRAVLKRLEGKP
jgi:uncharacterized protein YdiU (UPF0061 family)